jgi:S1-C subfamily serine protease/Tfp pilus assembly protein PilF
MRPTHLLVALLLVLPAAPAPGQPPPRDLRDQFGTRSLEAAQHLAKAIDLAQNKKLKEALEPVKAAIAADPRCQMAHFWHGNILLDLGDVEEAMTAYKKSLSDEVNPSANVSANAAVNLAMTLAKLKQHDEANVWFTRAILEDPTNGAGQRGKAYRNLAINLRQQGKSLSAAVALALALQDKAPNTDMKMVRDFFDKAEEQEAAALLFFGDEAPKLEKRAQENKLAPVALEGGPTVAIADVLADPGGRYAVALPANADHYFFIKFDGKPSVAKVAAPAAIAAACLADGSLYTLTNGSPLKIEKLEVETGKSKETFTLKGNGSASSLAVLPARGLAFFCADRVVVGANLKTGAVVKSDVPGQVVVAHPNQRYLYSYVKPERQPGGYILIDGRPVLFRPRGQDWLQTTLFKSVVTPAGPLLAEVRENVASNAFRMSLSPDGKWIAVAGGGGFRPTKPADDGAGYGVAVFGGHSLEHLQGFYKTENYPQGVCFNPVTGQVAAVRGDDARVYHLSDPKNGAVLTGKFSGAGAWSSDGKYLVLGNNGPGVSVFENTLTEAERERGTAWRKDVRVLPIVGLGGVVAHTVGPASFEPVEALKTFAVVTPTRDEAAALVRKAVAEGRTTRPGLWLEYSGHFKDDAQKAALQEARQQVAQKADLGIVIFQMKTILKATPECAPAHFFMAEALRLQERNDDAEKAYLATVHADAGRTELSGVSLNRLAGILAAQDKELAALYCLASSLQLDRANPGTLTQTAALLKKAKFDAEAELVGKLTQGLPGTVARDLPKLPKPEGEPKKHTPAELYRKAVWSVVLIETAKGSGSGVCVARPEIVVTNDHVVGEGGEVFVSTFIQKDKELIRMPKVRATVIFRSPQEDVAVLRLEKAPEHLKPLPVAAADAGAGDKVYAIGSPGLGREVLEQSISEGLVSSPKRKIDGNEWLQHSAAVNPGNSGGPLLDEYCQVVGLVTVKAKLENVSFAIRVETLRRIFNSP